MAKLNNPPSMGEYQNTGFYNTTNIPELQKQLANYQTEYNLLRQQAENYYSPTYNQQRLNLQNQLSQIDSARDRDINKLNTQYNSTLAQQLTQLDKRNMGRSSLVSTKGVEIENARNQAASDTSLNYLTQANTLQSNLQNLDAEYAQNIETKTLEMQKENQANRINLMTQIASLQQNGYSAYVNYLLNK